MVREENRIAQKVWPSCLPDMPKVMRYLPFSLKMLYTMVVIKPAIRSMVPGLESRFRLYVVPRVLACGIQDIACEAGEGDLDVGACKQCGNAQLADSEYYYNDDVGNQGHPGAYGSELRALALNNGLHAEALASVVDVLGLNKVQEDNADTKRDKGRYNVGKLVGEVVGAPPLGNCEGSADNQSVHPAVAQAFLAVQDQNNQQRNKEGEERCLVTNDSSNVLCRFEGNGGIAASNHVACGGDGGTGLRHRQQERCSR